MSTWTAGQKEKAVATVVYALLTVGAIIVVLPFLYALATSFKSQYEALQIPMRWLPSEWHFENYTEPFARKPLVRYFANSTVVAACVTLLNLLTCGWAGYSFAKFRYKGQALLFIFVLATLMVPIQVIVVPLFTLVQQLGWLNSYPGLIIPAGTSAFGVFLMRQYILGIPSDFIEAARIDGCGELRIFFDVIMPMAKPAFSALAIFIFMNNWNSFLWPLLVVQHESMMTLPLGLASFESNYSSNYGQLMAVSLMSAAPVLIVFALLQRQFIQGMALSGLKQ